MHPTQGVILMAKRHTVPTPKPVLDVEQLGTADAYRHELVVQHAKYSTARRAAKRFIGLFGQKAFDAKLTEVPIDMTDQLAAQVTSEFTKFGNPEVQKGIDDAIAALVETYTGAKPVTPSDVQRNSRRSDQVVVRNVVSSYVHSGLGRKLQRLAKSVEDRQKAQKDLVSAMHGAPIRKMEVLPRGEHIQLGDS